MTRASAVRYSLPVFMAAVLAGILALGAPGLRAGNPPPQTAPAQAGSINNEECAACHDDLAKAFDKNPHALLEKNPQYNLKNSCESCHGPGQAHAEGSGDKTKIISFKGVDSRTYNRQCLSCHRISHGQSAYSGSVHAKASVNCSDCHRIHSAARASRLLKEPEPALCLGCHVRQRSDFSKPYHHRVKEGAVRCADCHQPHSGLEKRQVRLSTLGDLPCVRCHAETQGPFVYEHAPTKVRGCMSCHEPHGSVNPKMLTRTTLRSLCLECHSRTASAVASQPPAIHNLRDPRYQNCTTCHVKIHGSNASRTFMR